MLPPSSSVVSKQLSKQLSKMASFSKKFVSSFLRDSVNTRAMSIVRLFESPLQEVKVVEPNFDSYTAIRIDPYTLEEQLIMYPMVVVVHNQPVSSSIIIDVE
jgi:hypothetical protein